MTIIEDYTALIGAQTAIQSAKNLPNRFYAVLNWQSDLASFCLRYPTVLRLGVERVIALDDAGASALVDVVLAEHKGKASEA